MEALDTIYTPRTILAALLQMPPPQPFLWNLLNKSENELDTHVVEIDVEKHGENVAAYVSRKGDPEAVKKVGFDTNIHVLPYMNEEYPISATDIQTRMAGENAYSGMGAAQRRDAKMAKWLMLLRDRVWRRKEQQLAEGLQTGKVLVSGKDIDYEIDYKMEASHLITNAGADIWGSGTEDKIAQLEAAAGLVRTAGAPTVTTIIMGENAANLFLQDADVLKYLDNRRIQGGMINPQQLANQNVTYLGDFMRIGLNVEIYSYQGKYIDTAGSSQSFIDPDNIVICSRAMRVETHYGMIENMHHGSFIGKEFPYVYVDPNGKNAHLSLETGALAAVHQPDSVVTITVK